MPLVGLRTYNNESSTTTWRKRTRISEEKVFRPKLKLNPPREIILNAYE